MWQVMRAQDTSAAERHRFQRWNISGSPLSSLYEKIEAHYKTTV